MLEME
jgi:hypothetical protein